MEVLLKCVSEGILPTSSEDGGDDSAPQVATIGGEQPDLGNFMAASNPDMEMWWTGLRNPDTKDLQGLYRVAWALHVHDSVSVKILIFLGSLRFTKDVKYLEKLDVAYLLKIVLLRTSVNAATR